MKIELPLTKGQQKTQAYKIIEKRANECQDKGIAFAVLGQLYIPDDVLAEAPTIRMTLVEGKEAEDIYSTMIPMLQKAGVTSKKDELEESKD